MNKLPRAKVLWFFNLFFLKARLEVCLFARVGNHFPSLCLHCPCLIAAEYLRFYCSSAQEFSHTLIDLLSVESVDPK
jgi:hypothetical protein